jgi:hypothetical protein
MQMVQSHPVPDPGLLHMGRQLIANLRKHHPQSSKPSILLGRCIKRHADLKVHIGSEYNAFLYEVLQQRL